MSENCFICGDNTKKKLFYTMNCNHCAHYECIMKSFSNSKGLNECPYCRKTHGLLPMVNGIKAPVRNIHYYTNNQLNNIINEYKPVKCKYTLKSGKNKGNICNSNCAIGFEYCGRHNQCRTVEGPFTPLPGSANQE